MFAHIFFACIYCFFCLFFCYQAGYKFAQEHTLGTYLRHVRLLTDDEAYDLSLKHEERKKAAAW